MGLVERYVVDSYALIAWLDEGQPTYAPYFQHIHDHKAYANPMALMEFYFVLYNNYGKEAADQRYAEVVPYLVVFQVHDDYIKEAAAFRSQMLRKKKKCSYTDSLNYVMAKRLHTKVLTGDKKFQGMPHVEFVQ